jgi:O-methyltransferase
MALAHKESGRIQRQFHLFDSFEGLHQPSTKDADFLHCPNLSDGDAELKATGACVGESKEAVESFLVNRLKLDPQSLTFHVGWFRDTIPAAAPGIDKISLLRLDGDLYKSTKQALDGLYEKVQPGGYVIIDDYRFAGCKQALTEYFQDANLPELLPFDTDSVYFRKTH